MLSPDAFTRSHKRHVTDMIRVSLERKGIIGFIEIHEKMTLLEARKLIWENVENAPSDFQFVLDDGVPVSARQESTQQILHFYPCVKIREAKKPSLPTTTSQEQGSSDLASPTKLSQSNSTEKISVWTAAGDEFAVWIAEDYTFQQLRRDAARYWNLVASQVALVDCDGCLWPEQARILSVLDSDTIRERKIILDGKAGSLTKSVPANSTFDTMSQRSSSTSGAPSRRRASSASLSTKTLASWRDSLSTTTQIENPVDELWRVFTFYCASGDSLELECIRAHQFSRLLKDARLLGPSFTPAMADIVYASETKGKLNSSSSKMNFDEFLNALVKIAVTRHKKSTSRHLTRGVNATQHEDELFQRLVVDNILPLASRWPVHLWDIQTQALRSPEIVSFASKFLEPLMDIYLFYAKSHLLTTVNGVKAFYMSYADYQRFVNDFAFANLQISSVEAAQIFLAACSSPPMHEALNSASARDGNGGVGECTSPRHTIADTTDQSSTVDGNSDTFSCSSASTAATAVAAAYQKITDTSEGVVVFSPPECQIGRICMTYSAFLDALGRLGITSFAKSRTVKPIQSVKAVFHHLSRGLSRSRVLGIVQNHGSTSIHSGRFYSGSVAFNNRFLDMWRYEGSPDYLSGGGEMAQAAEKSGSMVSSPVSVTSPGGRGNAPVSPSKRLNSSAAMFDERVVQNGAGRGREALDRLVRNAFIRNAASTSSVNATMSQMKVDEVAQGSTVNDLDREYRTVMASPAITKPPPPPPVKIASNSSASDATKVESSIAQSKIVDAAEPPPETPRQTRAVSLSSSLTIHPDDEKALYESILLKGGVFKKYGQWGNPHRRFVWCSKDFDGVFWRPINKKHTSMSKDGIAVSSFVAVLPGNSPRTRYAFMKHLSEEKSLSRCFSLLAEDRRLDLEADSEATRDLWMQALLFLMRQPQPRSLVSS